MSLELRGRSRLAVLIDAENISARRVKPLFGEVAKLGTATAKRIYGDWTRPQMAQWRNVLHEYAIVPVQQFRLSAGRNRVDCALIVDAMDLLHAGRFDGFRIVSSDSDFTRLASRLRESGLFVYGFGEATTPEAFIKSCDAFISLAPPEPSPEPTLAPSSSNGAAPTTRLELGEDELALLRAAYRAVAGEDGWVDLALFGDRIRRLSPAFSPRAFGCDKLSQFVETTGFFEVKKTASGKNSSSFVWHVKWME